MMHQTIANDSKSSVSTAASKTRSLVEKDGPSRTTFSSAHICSSKETCQAADALRQPAYEPSTDTKEVNEHADLDPVIMAFNWASGMLGCAYYAHEFRELCVMEDIAESPTLSFAPHLLDQVAPHIVILANDSALTELVQKDANGMQLEKLPNKEFTYHEGRYNLISWFARTRKLSDRSFYPSSISSIQSNFGGATNTYSKSIFCSDPYDGQRRQISLELACLIDLESQVSVGCAGALLVYLAKIDGYAIRGFGNTTETSTALNPLHLRYFSSTICMQAPAATQRALGIFETDQHPNTHQRRGKESLSLFGLLNHAVSPIGQHLLKSWLQRPTLDLETIRFRQQSISRFVSAGIEDLTKELRSHLRHVKNVSRLISAVSEHCATSGDWQQLLQFVYHGSKVYVIFQSMVDPILYIRRKILSAIDEKLFRRVGDAINETIDFAQSKAEGRVVVKQHVDPELDQLKDTYAGLDSVLLEVAEEISPELPPVLRAISNVVYFPQLGYFVSIGREHEGMFEHNMGLPPSFRLQFKTAETAYFKNDRTKELDDSLGDVHEMIVDREIELLHDLTERLSEYFPPLLDMADACAELDCLLALAHVARLHNYVQPELTLDNRVEITQGRHPLHELTVDVFIPNDTILVGGLGLRPSEQTEGSRMTVSADGERDDEDTIRASVALLTGANFSGKSVYVRQVALIVYMAHIGSFVPASRAIIGLTDKMFTCVQAAETVSKPMSAFALDIEQLSQAIHHATERSLVVIDEFGSGTDIMDGAALLCATIEYLLAKEAKCPKVLAITHFHDLLAQKLISSDDPRISLLTMEILSQAHRVGMPNCTKSSSSSSSSSTQVDEVVFLYRVAPGTQATNSYGAWCASIAGVPPAIVRRALQLSHLIDNNLPIKPEYSHAEQTLLDNIESAVQTFLGTSIAAENIKSLRELVRRVNEMI